MNRQRAIRLIFAIAAVLLSSTAAEAASKVKYPGGKFYIWRYTLADKQGSTYSLEHPGRWLSHKSIERRRRQNLPLDSTDLPVSEKYLREMERYATHGDRSRESHEGRPVSRRTQTHFLGTSRWNNTVLIRSNDTTLLCGLAELEFVREARQVWVSPDSIDRSTPKVKVHDKWNPWDSIRGEHYGNGRDQIEMLQGHRLHNIGFKGRGMTIAVLDGGFQNCDQIPAIQRATILGARDFVCPEEPWKSAPVEYIAVSQQSPARVFRETDHGTKVLSAMAANEPQILVGTAPEARYWLLRCEDQQTEQPVEEDYWTMAAEFADSAGVDIISSSLGYNEYDGHRGDYRLRDLDGKTALISRTASLLARKGIILINSAGNLGMGPWKKITFPADAEDILTVGAVNNERKNAPFCGVGPTQDGRVKPDVLALGSPASLISGRGTLIRDMGTSFSTPIVAGLVACLWQSLPNKTALEIIHLVRQTSSQYQEPDNIYGYGIPNFWRAYMIGKAEIRGER